MGAQNCNVGKLYVTNDAVGTRFCIKNVIRETRDLIPQKSYFKTIFQ